MAESSSAHTNSTQQQSSAKKPKASNEIHSSLSSSKELLKEYRETMANLSRNIRTENHLANHSVVVEEASAASIETAPKPKITLFNKTQNEVVPMPTPADEDEGTRIKHKGIAFVTPRQSLSENADKNFKLLCAMRQARWERMLNAMAKGLDGGKKEETTDDEEMEIDFPGLMNNTRNNESTKTTDCTILWASSWSGLAPSINNVAYAGLPAAATAFSHNHDTTACFRTVIPPADVNFAVTNNFTTNEFNQAPWPINDFPGFCPNTASPPTITPNPAPFYYEDVWGMDIELDASAMNQTGDSSYGQVNMGMATNAAVSCMSMAASPNFSSQEALIASHDANVFGHRSSTNSATSMPANNSHSHSLTKKAYKARILAQLQNGRRPILQAIRRFKKIVKGKATTSDA